MNALPVVVTGASSGIGRAVALRLAQGGVPLHLLGRDRGRLAAVASEAASATTLHPFDLTDDEALLRFASDLGRAPLAGLVHSAGLVRLGPVATQPVADLDAHYRLNLRAPYLLTQALLGALEEGGGTVVFVNSGSGLRANAGWSQYAASKFALRALADALRQEVAARGVRVTSVYPGRTATPMQREVRRMENEPYREDAYVPPETVAELVRSAFDAPAGVTLPDLAVRGAG